MIKVEIDGKPLDVEQGSSIIKAADDAGINIPRFCYHKKLSVAANCRMCLVEVVGAPKPMPACATPVAEGMQVKTKSAKALMAQRAVMEFLLINHPLDCPICDQGGQCELQDVSMGYGNDVSKYSRGKRSVKDEDIGPLIATGMTRCIHCTRCVRFGEEVAGVTELGLINRGEDTEIRSFINNSVDSELSGNMIDLCPVGALTSKPFRFSARAWELQQSPSIAQHDAIGSNIYVHAVGSKVKQVVPRENEDINEVWLSDRDRFSYEALGHEERVLQPMARIDGKLEIIDWEDALVKVTEAIAEQVALNPKDLIALVSPNASVEEGYLLQKLFRSLGSNSIDHRLNRAANHHSDSYSYGYRYGAHNIKLTELENSDSIFLVGSCPRKSMPLLNHRIRKAAKKNAKIHALNPVAYDWNYDLATENIVPAHDLVVEMAGILKQIYISKGLQVPNYLDKLKVSNNAERIAESLISSSKPVLIFGLLAQKHPNSELLYKIYETINSVLDSASIVIPEGANSIGLEGAGVLPYKQAGGYNVSKPGYSAATAFELPKDHGVYILYNIEPEFDMINGAKALSKLHQAKKVICITPYLSSSMRDYADIVLPLAPFSETSGTVVNIEHEWQSFAANVSSKDNQVRPGWKILCALAYMLDVNKEEFSYQSSAEVKQEVFGLKEKVKENHKQQVYTELDLSNVATKHEHKAPSGTIFAELITEKNCHRVDSIVRRAKSLQQTADAKHGNYIFISHDLAEQLKVSNNDNLDIASIDDLDRVIIQEVIIDPRLPSGTAYMSTGHERTIGFDKAYMQVVLSNSK